MTYAGIDFDTHAVHVVLLADDENETGAYYRFNLSGADAFDRTRTVAQSGLRGSFWDDVVAAAIEEPAGRMTGFQFRVQGAILACLPPTLLVDKFMPSQWRKAVGLPGNATKEQVRAHARSELTVAARPPHDLPFWPQDAFDAYCLAVAVSRMVETEAAA